MKQLSFTQLLALALMVPSLSFCMKESDGPTPPSPVTLSSSSSPSAKPAAPLQPVSAAVFKKIIEPYDTKDKLLAIVNLYLYLKIMRKPCKHLITFTAQTAKVDVNAQNRSRIGWAAGVAFECADHLDGLVEKYDSSDIASLIKQCGYPCFTKEDAFAKGKDGKSLKDPLHPPVLSFLPTEAQDAVKKEADWYLTERKIASWNLLSIEKKEAAASVIFILTKTTLVRSCKARHELMTEHLSILDEQNKKVSGKTISEQLKRHKKMIKMLHGLRIPDSTPSSGNKKEAVGIGCAHQ